MPARVQGTTVAAFGDRAGSSVFRWWPPTLRACLHGRCGSFRRRRVSKLLFAKRAHAADDPFFGTDKALHFVVAGAIAGTGYGITTAVTGDRWKALAVGGGVAIEQVRSKRASTPQGTAIHRGRTSPGMSSALRRSRCRGAIDVAAHGGKAPPLDRISDLRSRRRNAAV